jgi:hypothetical protein
MQDCHGKSNIQEEETLFTSKLGLYLRKKLVKWYIWSIALHGSETWTVRKVDQKYVEDFEIWYWRRLEKISCMDRVKIGEVLHRVKGERNILHTVKRRKADWTGHILRRNCLLKHVIEGMIEGMIEVTGSRRRRRKQLIDDLEGKRGCSKFKEEALDRTTWRTRFGRGYGLVIKQTTNWIILSTYSLLPMLHLLDITSKLRITAVFVIVYFQTISYLICICIYTQSAY